jgi:hypothetical protein
VDLATFILRMYIGPDDIPPENLRVLVESSTKNFREAGKMKSHLHRAY